MGSLRLAFLRTHFMANNDDPNNVSREDHVVMEVKQEELLEEFLDSLNRHLVGKKAYTKQEIWSAIEHAAVDLVSDFKRNSVRIL